MARATLRVGFLVLLLAGFALQPAAAQTYSFSLDRLTADVYFQEDGSARIEYEFVFTNDPGASPMDYVDVGLPNDRYDLGSITASVDGTTITHIARSAYVEHGVELGLGAAAIRPGATGTIRTVIGRIEDMLFAADLEGYASVGFSPTWYDRQYVHGTTDSTVTFHLPPGVQPDEPRWFEVRGGWPTGDPLAFLDPEGRIAYQWHNPSANGYTQYQFGAAFPTTYVPAGAILQPSVFDRFNVSLEAIMPCLCFSGMGLFFLGWIVLAVRLDRRRKMAYLPPKIAIEGHGIKRGLTAVEAAVLLETPLDRVLTMILFGVIKKNAARVTSEKPLTLEAIQPLPEDLHDYEKSFLEAALLPEGSDRHKGLQRTVVDMVKAVQAKMKGFSLRETKDYYRSVTRKAWQQVEEAGTPEVRSKRFDEALEWTMLDRDFDDRTRRTFRTGPVYVPMWWGNFRPAAAPAARPAARPAAPSVSGGRPGGGVTLPHLPGSDFAAAMVTGVQNTAGRLVSNITDFTRGVTRTTNPPPPPPRAGKSSGWSGRSGGGGSSCICACACACAGCACACAGGGR